MVLGDRILVTLLVLVTIVIGCVCDDGYSSTVPQGHRPLRPRHRSILNSLTAALPSHSKSRRGFWNRWRRPTRSLLAEATPSAPTLPPMLEVSSQPDFKDPNDWQPFHVSGTPKMITLFSTECNDYFDWQTLGLMYSFKRSGQPGQVVRLQSCNEDELQEYKGMGLAPTMVVPNWRRNPHSGDIYPAINKPVGVAHWLEHASEARDVEWVLILDADQILRRPILPWELGAERGHPVAAPYGYLVGCDNILAKLHSKDPKHCDKVGGVLAMHIDDLRRLVPSWIARTEEVRADKDHYATNITGDIFSSGWISEMYGYSFGSSDTRLHHIVNQDVMLYPGYPPLQGSDPRLLHYGLSVSVLDWTWGKSQFRTTDVVYSCGGHFPDPPDLIDNPPAGARAWGPEERRKHMLTVELVAVLNRAIREFHRRILRCPQEEDADVGVVDLNSAGLAPGGRMWVDIEAEARWLGRGEEWKHPVPVGSSREEESAVDVEGAMVDWFLLAGRAGLERGLLVRVEGDEGVLLDGTNSRDKSDAGRRSDGSRPERQRIRSTGGTATRGKSRGRSQSGSGGRNLGGKSTELTDGKREREGIRPGILGGKGSKGGVKSESRKRLEGTDSSERDDTSHGQSDGEGARQQQQQAEEEDLTARLDLEQARDVEGGKRSGGSRRKGLGFLHKQLVTRDQEFYEGGGAGDWEDDWDVMDSSDVLHLLSPMQVLVFFCIPWALVAIIVTLLVASRVLRLWRKNKSGRVKISRSRDVMTYNDEQVDEENLRSHDIGNLVKDA